MRSSNAIRLAVGLMAALLIAIPAAAQAAPTMHFTVPFAFLAGDQMLPAGAYSVTFDKFNRAILQCRTGSCGTSVLVAFETAKPVRAGDTGSLRFDQYGDFYVLRQVGKWGSTEWSELAHSERAIQAARMRHDAQSVSIGAQ